MYFEKSVDLGDEWNTHDLDTTTHHCSYKFSIWFACYFVDF